LELCTPFKLYFNYNLIKRKYQVSNELKAGNLMASLTRVLVLEDFHLDVLLR